MKCRFLRDMEYIIRPGPDAPASARRSIGIRPAGFVLEDPDAYKLVEHGVAEPADEECAAAVRLTPAELERVRAAYPRIAAGIHPDDYEAFDEGRMVGYNPDGSWKPGPNAEPEEDSGDDEGPQLWLPTSFEENP